MREGRDLEGSSSRLIRWVGCLIRLIVICAFVGSPCSLGAIGTNVGNNAEEDALGFDAPSSALVFGRPEETGRKTRVGVEVGKRRLFGIDGLTIDAVRLDVHRRRWGISAAAVRLSSPVGGEGSFGIALLFPSLNLFGIAPTLQLDTVSFDDFQRSYALSATVHVFARVSRAVVIGSTVKGIGIGGERYGGADAVCRIVLCPESSVCGITRLSVTRNGNVGFGVSSRLRISRVFVAAFGYEDETGMLKGSMDIRVSSIRVNTGASIHPVLGVSESLSVAWGW